MSDEIILFGSGLDQPIESSDEWVLDKIRSAVVKAREEQNVDIAINACQQLVRIAKTSGRGLAEGLYLVWKDWDKFGMSKDVDPISYIQEHTGLHRATVDRYITVARMLNNPEQSNIPPELLQEISQRNIKELIPIAKSLEQGYEISEKEWKRFANAADFTEVAQIIREDVKGVNARKSILIISMDKMGNLSAYNSSGKRVHIGYLEVDVVDSMAEKAIERIISGSGILRADA